MSAIANRPASFDARELAPTRAVLEDARHLPGQYYTSPEIYAMELEELFMKDWLVVGRVEEFDQPGDYRTMNLVGEPVLVCRDNEGSSNAFSNTCLHRGAEIATGVGNVKNFSCPFHAWVYDLKGAAPRAVAAEGAAELQLSLVSAHADQGRHVQAEGVAAGVGGPPLW